VIQRGSHDITLLHSRSRLFSLTKGFVFFLEISEWLFFLLSNVNNRTQFGAKCTFLIHPGVARCMMQRVTGRVELMQTT
jgi:hypothetical protein